MKIKRFDIVQADLSGTVGSEQGGIRPVLIIQNDIGNLHSPTTIVVCSRKLESLILQGIRNFQNYSFTSIFIVIL